ncbi:MAG: four helix bundle protein [Opitutales bacterium]|nr:four helix bundle protein [Opitutales bacterium]
MEDGLSLQTSDSNNPTPKQDMQFKDLEAWQKARLLVSNIYSITRSDQLKNDFGLSSQIQRSAVSTMTNISEGFERTHIQEKIQFYNIGRASCGETRSLLYVIQDNYEYLSEQTSTLIRECISVGKLISGLINSTEKRK